MDRRNVDDPAVAAGLHAGQGEPHGVEDRVEVNLDHLIPLLHRELLHGRHLPHCAGVIDQVRWTQLLLVNAMYMLDAGVVDDDVDVAKLLCAFLDQVLHLFGLAAGSNE